jgi:hypothetical protein
MSLCKRIPVKTKKGKPDFFQDHEEIFGEISARLTELGRLFV